MTCTAPKYFWTPRSSIWVMTAPSPRSDRRLVSASASGPILPVIMKAISPISMMVTP